MVRLTRLKIDRFRNVAAGTDLHFGPTFNVLLGRNATGKTTLLDLVAAVTNDDFSAYVTEEAGFDLTWWLESDGYQLEIRVARTPDSGASSPHARLGIPSEFRETVKLVASKDGEVIQTCSARDSRGTWVTSGEEPVDFEARWDLGRRRPTGHLLLSIPDWKMPPWFLSFFVKKIMGRFDEGTAALATMSKLTFSRPPDSFAMSLEEWLPDSLLGQFQANVGKVLPAIDFANVPPLATIPPQLGFTSAEMQALPLSRSEDGDTYSGLNFLFSRNDGSQISHSLLSFGQKRLFSFLWYLAARGDLPVVADELLNGLHHEWIEACFERLHDRQSFLATQHPFLLDHIPIASAEAVKTTFVRCSTCVGPHGQEQLVWRNFGDEEADRFYVAYETGIQHVSEVLRSEGLW